jgi:hypothetical protein
MRATMNAEKKAAEKKRLKELKKLDKNKNK